VKKTTTSETDLFIADGMETSEEILKRALPNKVGLQILGNSQF
jgi:hypothetical protein